MDWLASRRLLRYAEYGFLVLIIGLLVLFLLNKAETIQKDAERMAVMGAINALQGGALALLDLPEGSTAEDLRDMNPVQLLETPPGNYLGPLRNPREREIQPGSWYFRPDRGILVYRARFTHDFPFTEEPTRRLRFAIEPQEHADQVQERRILGCGPNVCLTIQ